MSDLGRRTEGRRKIEIVRVPSNERGNFRSLEGVRSNCKHIRVGTCCPEPEIKMVVCDGKPPIEQTRKFKKNLGPVSKLLRRRHHATYLATKSCDNIYSVNRSSSLDWRASQTVNEQGLQSRQSSSLDWRVGRSINKLHWRDTTRSAEHLSRSGAISSDHLQTPSTKSKLVSLLRRLSPRLSRPGSKNSLQSSPTICPWVQVEYSSESINNELREDSQESDVTFQRELQLNEIRKRMAGIPTTSQVTTKIVKDGGEEKSSSQPRTQAQQSESDYCNAFKSVHEDRGGEDHRRASGQTRGGGEVAGLEDVGDCCAATLTPSVPGAAGIRSNLRTRPLSLAVQPLNYRRLDPDPKINTIVNRHHPNMTSQESIGSCSLDVEQSASDRSEDTIDTVSKKALHSLNLSCNGDSVSSADNRTNGSSETLQKSHLTVDEKLNVSNGHRGSPGPEQLTVKKPSYLGLACSISGYSGINRYDSKLREGFRSRDSSPGTRLIARETSPAGFRSNEHLNVPVHPYPPKSQSISPLAMDRQNGFSNGLKEECKIETYRESRSSIAICQGYSEVDKGVLYTTFPDISPIRSNASAKRSPGMSPMMSCSQQNKHFAGSSPKHTTANLSNTSFSDTSILNGSSTEGDSRAMNNSSNSEKSFIQQRVERLYGPGALAQGFFFKRSTSRLNASDSSFNKSSNNNDVSTENANTEESLKNLPVLRHLRPEFRAQLPVASPRRPTDGSEQTLKPLQRVTPVSRKVEQKGKLPAATHLDGSLADSSGQKLNSSVTSIPDQQPAAPKVVLPVLEPSASSTSVAKQVQEAEQTEVEEKDGHYFTTLLKRETDRLLSLAASAEAELASGDTVALPEEAAGKLRSAAGKARLLASQKMQQFEGLCQKNINQVPGEEFPTTDEDLAGFWDMVMLQVVQVNDLFDQIEKLRNSQWQEVCSDSIYPQTSLSTRTPEKPSRCHVKIDKVKPAKLPSCRSSSHSVNDKHSRFDVMLFNEQDESPHLLNNSLQLSEQFPLEARLCNDVFQVLNLPDHLEEDELYCANFDEDSNPFVSDCITNVHAIENDSLPVNPCTSYIVNYLNLLQHNTDPFYLEKPEHASYNFYPRGDYFKDNFYDHDLTHKSSDVKVIFENEQKNNDFSNVSEYKSRESIPEYSPKPSTEEKDGMPDVKSTFLSDKENKSVERKLENPRSKAKSCSSVGRNLNHDAQIKSRGKIGSRTPGKKYQKNDSIKSDTDGQHKYRNSKSVIASKKNEEKVLVSSKNYKSHDKSSLLSRKENVKKRGHSVKFSDNIQEFPESEKQISVDNCKGGKVKKVSLQPVLGKPEKKTHPTKMKNIKQVNNNCDEKMNLSVMTEVWSNLDTQGHKRKSQGIVDKTPKKNCTFSETPNMKKYVKHFVIEHVEESPKKVECGTDNASEISDIIWRLSDSKPFIPLSQEVLRQLREVYNVENQSSVSLNLERSKKLERMKLYDKKRKLILKKQGDGTPRKVISRRSSWHPLINPPINPYASRNLQDSIDATTEIRKPISENRNISVQCLIDTTNFKPCVINKENELTLLNSITDNISDCPEKYKTQDVLSGMVCSLNSEIMSSVTKQSSITLKNRESVRNLRCGIIAETYKSPNINTNVFVTISHHVHSDFVVRSLPDRTVGKGIELIHFNNYLPLRRELYADRYPKDLKYIPLLPQNIHVHSNPSDLKTFPIKIKHLCTFVKSNRTLCRLSLYLYMYGILSLVLIFMKMGSSNEYLLDSRIFYNLY